MQASCAGDVRVPEDMQEYLARMNKQLEEMAAQHLLVRPMLQQTGALMLLDMARIECGTTLDALFQPKS